MAYAAGKQFVAPAGLPGGDAEAPAALPWELDAGLSTARSETWLLSFIDILALLLTLFVLLLAYQEQDFDQRPERARPVTDLLALLAPGLPSSAAPAKVLPPAVFEAQTGYALPGAGLLPQAVETPAEPVAGDAGQPSGPEPVPAPQTPPAAPAESLHEAAPLPASFETTAEPAPPASFPPHAVSGAGTSRQRLIEALQASGLRERVELVAGPGDVSLEISDSILFPPASATLSAAGTRLLDELAALLSTLAYSLSVEGHTDDVPIRTPRYPSNWELSSARAAAVTRKLIEKGVDAARLRAIGYGATRPRADNASADGRARNRRVTFVLRLEPER